MKKTWEMVERGRTRKSLREQVVGVEENRSLKSSV